MGRNNQDILVFFVLVNLIICRSQVHAQDKDFIFPSSSNEIDPELSRLEDYGPNELTEDNIEEVSKVLAKLLLVPWPEGIAPILYVEKSDNRQDYFKNDASVETRFNDLIDEETMRPASPKRSKYYRKYPWKRQQNSRYDPAYICSPKKDDVYRLFVALNGDRNGKRGQIVDFCNRKRPASLVLTNIRFVG